MATKIFSKKSKNKKKLKKVGVLPAVVTKKKLLDTQKKWILSARHQSFEQRQANSYCR